MAEPKDVETYLKVANIIETQLAPFIQSARYVELREGGAAADHDGSENSASEQPFFYVYLVCRCKAVQSGACGACLRATLLSPTELGFDKLGQ